MPATFATMHTIPEYHLVIQLSLRDDQPSSLPRFIWKLLIDPPPQNDVPSGANEVVYLCVGNVIPAHLSSFLAVTAGMQPPAASSSGRVWVLEALRRLQVVGAVVDMPSFDRAFEREVVQQGVIGATLRGLPSSPAGDIYTVDFRNLTRVLNRRRTIPLPEIPQAMIPN